MVVKVYMGLVIAEIFVGFFNRNITDNDRKAPIITETMDNKRSRGKKEISIPINMAISIAGTRFISRKGKVPKTLPMKYIGKLTGEAT
jgi:hypothetical protein